MINTEISKNFGVITYNDKLKEYQGLLSDIKQTVSKIEKTIRSNFLDEWLKKGGCTTCQGTGSRVVWDTLDSLSGCYAEYGGCDQCTPERRAISGINYSYTGKYFNIDRSKFEDYLKSQTKMFYPKMYELENEVDHYQRKAYNFTKGINVIVKKGRKVPVGIIGKIFYLKESNYGLNVGFKDIAGNVYWNYSHNLEIIIEDTEQNK